MVTESEKKDEHATLTIRAIASLSVLITRLGGALVGIGAIAYLIGYNYVNSYYAYAEAPWVLSFFGSGEIIRAGAIVTFVVAASGLVAIIGLLNGTSSSASLGTWAKRLALVGLIPTMVVSFTPRTLLAPDVAVIVATLAGALIAWSAGLTIGELVGRLKDSGIAWKGAHLNLLWFVYMFAVVQAPSMVGRSSAQADLNPKTSKLPYVSRAAAMGEELRLLAALGDNLLVVSLAEAPEKCSFKVLKATDGWTISKQRPELSISPKHAK